MAREEGSESGGLWHRGIRRAKGIIGAPLRMYREHIDRKDAEEAAEMRRRYERVGEVLGSRPADAEDEPYDDDAGSGLLDLVETPYDAEGVGGGPVAEELEEPSLIEQRIAAPDAPRPARLQDRKMKKRVKRGVIPTLTWGAIRGGSRLYLSAFRRAPWLTGAVTGLTGAHFLGKMAPGEEMPFGTEYALPLAGAAGLTYVLTSTVGGRGFAGGVGKVTGAAWRRSRAGTAIAGAAVLGLAGLVLASDTIMQPVNALFRNNYVVKGEEIDGKDVTYTQRRVGFTGREHYMSTVDDTGEPVQYWDLTNAQPLNLAATQPPRGLQVERIADAYGITERDGTTYTVNDVKITDDAERAEIETRFAKADADYTATLGSVLAHKKARRK